MGLEVRRCGFVVDIDGVLDGGGRRSELSYLTGGRKTVRLLGSGTRG